MHKLQWWTAQIGHDIAPTIFIRRRRTTNVRRTARTALEEAIGLVIGLQGGRYWSITEQGRNRKAPGRLNTEQERSHTETNSSREISEGEPNSRQITPESSPQQPELPITQENYQGRYQAGQVCKELMQRNKTAMENLRCLQLLNPSMMGEDK